MNTKKAKITKRIVDALKPNETVWDTEIAGFGIRCQKRDKVYSLKKRVAGRQRWFTIGKHGEPYTAEMARDEALILLLDIKKGNDPSIEREKRKNRPSVSALMSRYLEEYAQDHKKASSIREDQANIKNHILPFMGKKLVSDLTIEDFEDLKRAIKAGKTTPHSRGGPGAANRCLALMSKAMNLAIKWNLRADNPVSHVTKYKENKIERYLSQIEFSALAQAINEEREADANSYAIAALQLLIFTGARKSEILSLKWSNVFFDKEIIRLDDSKTGAKSFPLNKPTISILKSIPRQENNPYVICGTKQGEHLVNIKRVWQNIRERTTVILWRTNEDINTFAKALPDGNKFKAVCQYVKEHKSHLNGTLVDLRIHDLRHAFASIGAMSGFSLPIIGKLLGHAQTSTTERYAHLADNPLKTASNEISEQIAYLMEPNKAK